MKSILVELMCRQCMYHTYRKSETLVLSDFETQARKDLLNDHFFTLRCPRCGALIEFIHPLAYVDTKHGFILLIKAKKDFTKEDQNLYREDTTSQKRMLYDHTKISEKIKIFEDGLDDRLIEILKLQLKRRYTDKKKVVTLQYHDFDRDSETIWFQLQALEEMQYVAVLYASYETFAQRMPMDHCNTFEDINEAWAIQKLKELN